MENKEIKLVSLPMEIMERVLGVLAEMPYKHSAELIHSIQKETKIIEEKEEPKVKK